MKFDVVTILPEILEGSLSKGVVGQAFKKDLLSIRCWNPRDFTTDVHRTVDDRPYGGGDGMVMLADPLSQAVEAAVAAAGPRRTRKIYLSPHGRRLTQEVARELFEKWDHLVLVCGRYGGVDQRFIQTQIDEELSVGDFVLSGGEFGALVVIDVLARLVPGVLGNVQSAQEDSFSRGILEHPQFTRPPEYKGISVPEALLSGNHRQIDEYRRAISILRTKLLRPDLMAFVSEEELAQAERLGETLSPEEKVNLGIEGSF